MDFISCFLVAWKGAGIVRVGGNGCFVDVLCICIEFYSLILCDCINKCLLYY